MGKKISEDRFNIEVDKLLYSVVNKIELCGDNTKLYYFDSAVGPIVFGSKGVDKIADRLRYLIKT